MLHRNLDVTDRVLRFALAFWWLGPWAPGFQVEWVNLAIFVLAWIALAESFLGWCGLHTLLGIHECTCDECEECA